MSNPLANNPFSTRRDLEQAVNSLFEPLLSSYSLGGARVQSAQRRTCFSRVEQELEGFARVLWGIGPLAAGGGEFPYWHLLRGGIVNGTNPEHPDYWGEPRSFGRILMEMTAVAFGLLLARKQLYDPLSSEEKRQVCGWFSGINFCEVHQNSWLLFPVIVNVVLKQLGGAWEKDKIEESFDRLDSCYQGDGWYLDGPGGASDYYVAFAIQFYSLLYLKLAAADDPNRKKIISDRALLFAKDFVCWFSEKGEALPYGQNLTARFAQSAFWSALVYAELPAFSWGELKGLALRNLRWWALQPICEESGRLSIGYAYPNALLAEDYVSAASPYWAFKAFLPLALPEDHFFWQIAEQPLPEQPLISMQPHAGMLITRDKEADHLVALSAGEAPAVDFGHWPEKYCKFEYSTAFGFSLSSDSPSAERISCDSMLALSDDQKHFRVREGSDLSRVNEGSVYAEWQPFDDVVVETWLVPVLPWYVRIHVVQSGRILFSQEGGFAVSFDGSAPKMDCDRGRALFLSKNCVSGLRDILRSESKKGLRQGELIIPPPNTNLIAQRTILPLRGRHDPGAFCLATAVLARPAPLRDPVLWDNYPGVQDTEESFSVFAPGGEQLVFALRVSPSCSLLP